MFCSHPVQTFLSGATKEGATRDKHTYQPGALRKVWRLPYTSSLIAPLDYHLAYLQDRRQLLHLGDIPAVTELGEQTVHELQQQGYTLCLSDFALTAMMKRFGAVMGCRKEVVNEGDYVMFMYDGKVNILSQPCICSYAHHTHARINSIILYHFLQKEFAKLLTCCEDADSKQSHCLLQLFERVESNSQQVLNDKDCPLLFLLHVLLLVPSTCTAAISIAHECTSECKYIPSTTTSRFMECEDVYLSGSAYKHNYSNQLFCLNVYSLKLHAIY